MKPGGSGWGLRAAAVIVGLLAAVALAQATELGPFDDGSAPSRDPTGATRIALVSVAQKQASPELSAYVARGDAICNAAYWKGVQDGKAVDRVAKERGYSNSENEAAWEYAQAGSMEFQYRELLKLGEAPDHKELMRRWIATSKHRADLMRAYAESWLYGSPADRERAYHQLRYAKYRADTLAGRLFFRTCGTPWRNEWVPDGGDAATSTLQRFTSRLTPEERALIRVGTVVYSGDQAIGVVTAIVPDDNAALVRFRIQNDDISRMASGQLGLYVANDPAFRPWFSVESAAASTAISAQSISETSG